jgi:flagellar protein FliO/FliZ
VIRFFPFRRVIRTFPGRLASVTRWLLVVAGCTGLELVQPVLAAEAATEISTPTEAPTAPAVPIKTDGPAAELASGTVLYPTGESAGVVAPRPGSAGITSTGWVIAGVVLIGGGLWVWLQRRRLTGTGVTRKLINVEETRSLGNRQFLVVASCDGRRLLLGVSPGRIATLADLDDLAPTATEISV